MQVIFGNPSMRESRGVPGDNGSHDGGVFNRRVSGLFARKGVMDFID